MSFTAVTHFQRRNKFGQFVRDLRLLKSAFCRCGAGECGEYIVTCDT